MIDYGALSSLGPEFLPHGVCLSWQPSLLALHVLSDGITALAYFSIPFGLAWYASRRKDLEYRWMFVLFAAFILACGTTHIMDIWILWRPDYVAQGVVKALTAIVSMVTAILLWPVLGRAMMIPSPRQLSIINESLSREIAMRRETVRLLEAEARERCQLETELRENEARLKAILDTAVEGVLTVNLGGIIELANPAAAMLFGFPPGGLEGMNAADRLGPVDGEPNLRRLFQRASKTRQPVELQGRHQDGRELLLEMAVGKYVLGEPHYTCMLRDITERRLAERRIQEQESRLKAQETELMRQQQLNTVVELTAMLAHEINQPLTAILNYVGGIRLRFSAVQATHPELAGIMDEIECCARRITGIIRTLRSLVKPRPMSFETIEMDRLVEEMLGLLNPELTRGKIAVRVEVDQPLPRVKGQRIQLRQMLLNLILNATEAMAQIPPERRHLDIRVAVLPPDRLGITLTDTGTGFSAEQAASIFEPFRTTKAERVGLGLSICKSIAEAHSGTISAESRGRGGATFTVTLPILIEVLPS